MYFQILLQLFFLYDKLRLEKVYLLSHNTTINMKLRVFQHRISNNVLYLNQMFFRFKSPASSFCKSSKVTPIHLFSSCLHSRYIWSQTQVFFSNYLLSLISCHTVPFLVLGRNSRSTYFNHQSYFVNLQTLCVSIKKFLKFKLHWS